MRIKVVNYTAVVNVRVYVYSIFINKLIFDVRDSGRSMVTRFVLWFFVFVLNVYTV